MGLFSCFGAPGAGEADVVVAQQARQQAYGIPPHDASSGKHAAASKGQQSEFLDLTGPPPKSAQTTTCTSGNTTSLSAVTTSDVHGAAYQLQILNAALAGLSGNWYERVSSAAMRLTGVSGAALCTVAILDAAHEHFTVIHVTGKDTEAPIKAPPGSQLPALQAVAPSAHGPGAQGSLRYNSAQVLQLLQTPLTYSFSDPVHASRETNQPPHDWQAMYDTFGLSDFCALPLMHNKSVVGAVTLAFVAPPAETRAQQNQRYLTQSSSTSTHQPASPLMACDEASMRTLGLLLSVLLVGQDMLLAQQVAEILAGVYDARNLQQVVTVVAAGAEQVLQLTTCVAVSCNLAVLAVPGAGPGAAPSAGTLSQPGTGAGTGGGGPPASVTSGTGLGGRAIFFEERNAHTAGSRVDGSTQGTQGSRSMASITDAHGSGSGLAFGQNYRSRLQSRANTPHDGQSTGAVSGAQANMLSPRRGGANNSANPLPHLSVRTNGNAHASQDSTSPPNGSTGGLLWQAGLVQARALGLRHTLLANLPPTGTIIHDCASYMQQVGCPKRDLYLLSTCQGAPPFSLAIAPAPLKEAEPNSQQLVLYVAVAMRLPMELLTELLSQAQQLAVKVLAPLLAAKLTTGNLADEWALLMGTCTSGRTGTGPGTGPGGAGMVASSPDPRMSSSSAQVGAGGVAGAGGGSKDAASGSAMCGSGGTMDGRRSSPGGSSDETGPGGAQRGGAGARHPQLPAALTAPPGHSPEVLPYAEQRGGTAPSDIGRVLGGPPAGSGSQESQGTVLSTAVGGAFAGDTRTHMGMLVSSFKDTINALQAARAEEAEELTVLKLGKVLGRGGSGLVFQGYLHLGLEVAVKLFENPDDTDPDAISNDEPPAIGNLNPDGSSIGPDAMASRGAEGGSSAKEGSKGQDGGGQRRNSSRSAAQMTKRQRDLLRNALELGVTSSISHPNIVQGYCHWVNVVLMQDASLNRCWLMGQAEYMALAPPGSPPPPLCSALVMEYCDMGSLIHALKRGTFVGAEEKPNMEFVYMCLLEIALALRHLHTAKIAHCDLKPGNVLLRSSPRDPRSFVCKLGDFGYAAILKDGLLPGRPAVLPDEACGTLQYMAPELFVAGRPVDASIDIYAFGLLMWELITGKTPYSDNEYGSRALMKAVYHGKRPTFPENTLPAYKNLGMCCWSGDPTLRPSASVLVKLLRQQLESLKQSGQTAGGANAPARA
ncbi:hypothetical protein HXX76_001886 [Chlamydomonas incerta]|uniref:Protein kinase domain-containing protein n=1 Tax=Chlamydomonas incerta TaxID=51695 RepID=A0A835W9Q7_CHLIN|nr:hypothetical protein HXX76_001886 [Chlamydomonas incerta]|eukprot:KAG2443534.1 hypothetical protein HXX76_001886 [Chlamydomonas incerta]